MITVEIDKLGITVDGHAGYAESGYDIVCAAVSALTQNLIVSLKEFTNDRFTHVQHDGHIRIDFKDLSEHGKLLVDSFFIGICGIANGYPECLIIK